MNTRERFRAVSSFQPFDRLPVLEWATWWDQTLLRWREEGLHCAGKSGPDICREFGQDVYRQAWITALHPDAPAPQSHGAGILSDEAGYDRLHPYFYQIEETWPVNPAELSRWAAERERGECAVWITLDGFFWWPRKLLGIEPHLYAFYDQPELMHRINRDLSEWMIRIIDRVCETCTPDFMTFAEDMSYNHGPMLSEALFKEFMAPYYERVIPHLEKRGVLPMVDSDGDVTTAAGWFRNAGVRGILPLERQAGVDILELREKYPDMVFMGHFDKMTMSRGEAAMRAEFERLLPTASRGGFFISCDHQTPPQVSLENYRIYLRLFREYAEKAGKASRQLLS